MAKMDIEKTEIIPKGLNIRIFENPKCTACNKTIYSYIMREIPDKYKGLCDECAEKQISMDLNCEDKEAENILIQLYENSNFRTRFLTQAQIVKAIELCAKKKSDMDKKEKLFKELKDLGVVYTDAPDMQTLEDVVQIIKETQKEPKFLAAPLVIDGMTDRKYFNSREKILEYFIEKNITDIKIKREILKEAMGAEKTFYTGAQTEEQKLLCDIEMYLAYQWVYGRQIHSLMEK